MAINFNEVNNFVRSTWLPYVQELMFKEIVMHYRLFEKRKLKYEKTKLQLPINAGEYPVYEHERGFEPIRVTPTDTLHMAGYDLGACPYATIPLTEKEQDTLTSKEKVIDVIGEKIKIARKSVLKKAEINCMAEIAKAVDDGDIAATYAEISRTDIPEWKAQIDDVGGTLNRTRMVQMYQSLTEGQDQPSIILTTPNLWVTIEEWEAEKNRYMDPALAKIGFPNVLFMNHAPVIKSSFVPAGTVYFLNEDYFYLLLHPDAGEKGIQFKDFKEIELSTVSYAQLWFKGKVICTNPKMQGAIRGLTE